MPSKSIKQTPVIETPTPVIETPTPVIETPPPVIKTVVSKSTKKGGAPVVTTEVAHVVDPVVAPVVDPVVDPVVTKPKRGGAKSKTATTPVTELVATPVVTNEQVSTVESVVVKKEPKKRVMKSKVDASSSVQEGGKPKQPKVKVVKTVVETDADDEEQEQERRVRSFKVKLPNKEEFEGRFTGLTPYQAANKALSKYFRETENPEKEITFVICESTRKSKKSTYTYIGKRYQLEVHVKYTIQDGREIVKNFKNSLKKVKKIDIHVEKVVSA